MNGCPYELLFSWKMLAEENKSADAEVDCPSRQCMIALCKAIIDKTISRRKASQGNSTSMLINHNSASSLRNTIWLCRALQGH